MAYNTRSNSNYGGSNKRSGLIRRGKGKKSGFDPIGRAKEAFSRRSEQSQRQDLMMLAPIAPNLEIYLAHPEKYDFPGVDTPPNVEGLCQLACSQPVDLEVHDTATKQRKKLRIVKKEDAKTEVEAAAKEAEDKLIMELQAQENSPILPDKPKRRLPSADEIYMEAVKLWRDQNGYLEDVANPTRVELQEEGLLNQAKLRLMTSADTDAERQTFDYLSGMRQKLNSLGFDIVPLSGFESTDLRF
jgi:hypothetical protein